MVENIKSQLSKDNCLDVFMLATTSTNCTALRDAALKIAARTKLCELQQDPSYRELDSDDIRCFLEGMMSERDATAADEEKHVLTKAQEGAAKNWYNNFEGSCPLHCAAQEGRLDLVKWILKEKKAKVDDKDKYGRTPLHYASGGHLGVVKYFVEDQGADV
eukprot:Selendium_serpulae@DN6287_c3_g1_i4.p1